MPLCARIFHSLALPIFMQNSPTTFGISTGPQNTARIRIEIAPVADNTRTALNRLNPEME
jgi:hypothetical protein